MNTVRGIVIRGIANVWSNYIEFHAHAPFKHRYLSYIGLVTFPAYYLVWTVFLPQPYENLGLRLGGMALCIVNLMFPWWPKEAKAYYYQFTYLTMALSLPVYFTFMLLMNRASEPWLLSTMAAFFFVVLVYDVYNSVIVSVIGSLVGIGLFFAVDGLQPLPNAYLMGVPVFAFTVIAVAFLAYNEHQITQEKLYAADLLASNIAHEMRTPLLGITMDCDRILQDVQFLPPILTWLKETGYPGPTLTDTEIQQTLKALGRIKEHTAGANQVVDMLLTNVGRRTFQNVEYQDHQIGEVIELALSRFHFKEHQKQLVSVHGDISARYWGSDVLLVHVLFNLLRNALKAIEAKGSGQIEIRCASLGQQTTLTFTDDGAGIPSELRPYIFMPFVTGDNRMHGAGIGLYFSRLVIESFGGSISLIDGDRTSFQLVLPRSQSTSSNPQKINLHSNRHQAASRWLSGKSARL